MARPGSTRGKVLVLPEPVPSPWDREGLWERGASLQHGRSPRWDRRLPSPVDQRGPGCEVGVWEEEELLCHEEGRGAAGAAWGQEQGVSTSWTRSWQSARHRCAGTGPRQGLCSCRSVPLALALGPPNPGAVPPAAPCGTELTDPVRMGG